MTSWNAHVATEALYQKLRMLGVRGGVAVTLIRAALEDAFAAGGGDVKEEEAVQHFTALYGTAFIEVQRRPDASRRRKVLSPVDILMQMKPPEPHLQAWRDDGQGFRSDTQGREDDDDGRR